MTFEAEQLGESGPELASLLRDLRKRAGLSGDRLAARCNMSQSKVSRIENGKTRPSLVDVEQILRALEAPPELVAEVSALARLANTEWRNLRELRRKGLGTRQAELKALEASSTHMRYFLLSMITGLLATPEYVRASLAHSPADTSRAVAGKLERQAILYDTSKRFTFLLTEQAIRWPVVSALALAEQMDRLSSLSYLPNVRIGVIPLRATTPRTPLNTFTIYDTSLVTIETDASPRRRTQEPARGRRPPAIDHDQEQHKHANSRSHQLLDLRIQDGKGSLHDLSHTVPGGDRDTHVHRQWAHGTKWRSAEATHG